MDFTGLKRLKQPRYPCKLSKEVLFLFPFANCLVFSLFNFINEYVNLEL